VNIVLLAPSGTVAPALDRLSLAEPGPGESVAVVTASARDAAGDGPVTTIRLGLTRSTAGARATSVLSGSAAGRNLLRLTPLDGGRRFAAAARRSPAFRTAIQDADLIVVLERDGILAGWRAARRWAKPTARAVFGPAPAEALLTEARAARDDRTA
jgi:hypothetical protein